MSITRIDKQNGYRGLSLPTMFDVSHLHISDVAENFYESEALAI
jgi:hypothetical protein